MVFWKLDLGGRTTSRIISAMSTTVTLDNTLDNTLTNTPNNTPNALNANTNTMSPVPTVRDVHKPPNAPNRKRLIVTYNGAAPSKRFSLVNATPGLPADVCDS